MSLTREQNAPWPDGRELDALVATALMDWTLSAESWYDNEGLEMTVFRSPDESLIDAFSGWLNWRDIDFSNLEHIPHYSTDIAAAWEVFEKATANIKEKGEELPTLFASYRGGWVCMHGNCAGDGETAPLAICHYALAITLK
ncbi:BC1872 family protein [Hymenobacter koreensis]|uniref:Phage ABA sandwich domain-containing protein n=1 Tax=Hymenobacter koreensis TaxID=1084523 RepID=A0ABP8JJ98_9BACT